MSFSLIAAVALASGPAPGSDVGPLVRALWLVQRYGTAEAVDPANDQRVKGVIFKALGKELYFPRFSPLSCRQGE
jgi:arsenate reductase (thioredoxin)